MLRTVGVELDRLVQRVRAVGVRDEVGGLRARHLDAGAQDDAGQTHAPDGGPEQLTLRVIRGALRLQVQDTAVGDEQLHGQDVVAEGTRGVVVLAVNIRPDRTTDRDLAGARQDGNPQAVG